MKVLWKAINGQDYTVEGQNIKEVMAKIEILRAELGIERPDAMIADTKTEEARKQVEPIADIDVNDLPEQEKAVIKEALKNNSIDPKNLN